MEAKDAATDILVNCIGGRTLQIARIVSSRFDNHLSAHGLTAQQLTLLCVISSLQPVRPRDILPFLKMEQSTLSRNLDRLVDNGWIEIAADDNDQRTKLVTLTGAGVTKIGQAHGAWQAAQRELGEAMGLEGVEQIKAIAQAFNPLLPSDRLRGHEALEEMKRK